MSDQEPNYLEFIEESVSSGKLTLKQALFCAQSHGETLTSNSANSNDCKECNVPGCPYPNITQQDIDRALENPVECPECGVYDDQIVGDNHLNLDELDPTDIKDAIVLALYCSKKPWSPLVRVYDAIARITGHPNAKLKAAEQFVLDAAENWANATEADGNYEITEKRLAEAVSHYQRVKKNHNV